MAGNREIRFPIGILMGIRSSDQELQNGRSAGSVFARATPWIIALELRVQRMKDRRAFTFYNLTRPPVPSFARSYPFHFMLRHRSH